jgi:hypothetical protein
MKVIISCCSKKNGNKFTHNGELINFVSQVDPNNAFYVHPDDLIQNQNTTWRELIALQEIRNDLLPAYDLYNPEIYTLLFQHFGIDLFIFSAGWGIVRADYRLPKYDITFGKGKKNPIYAVRNPNQIFNDFNQLEGIDVNEKIVFFAGKDYVIPFCQLTDHLPNQKIIIYKNQDVLNNNPYLNNNNFQFMYYQTKKCMNWHYEFAQKLITNEIEL